MDSNQFSSPFIVSADGETTLLERVPFGPRAESFTYSEGWLQDLLFDNPSSLPISEIDRAYGQWQKTTPNGPFA